jgi:ribose transport system substrate-binding protein
MRKLSVFVVICMCFGLIACSTGTPSAAAEEAAEPSTEAQAADQASETTSEKEHIKIGLSLPTQEYVAWVAGKDSFEKAAAKYNEEHSDSEIELVITIADNDATKQATQIADMVNDGADVIIASSVDATAILTSITATLAEGVPFINYGREVIPTSDDQKPTATFVSDGQMSSYVSTAFMFQRMIADGIAPEDIKFVHVFGSLTDGNSALYKAGVEQAEKEYGVEEVALVESEWNVDTLLARLSPVMQSHPEVNAIFFPATVVAAPVQTVLERLGRWVPYPEEGHVYLASRDADYVGCTLIQDGYLDGVGTEDLIGLANMTLEGAIKAVHGEEIEEVYVPCPLVSLDNFDEMRDRGLLWGLDYADLAN